MRVAVIGAGNMGGALVRGWAKSGELESISVADKCVETLEKLRGECPSLVVTTDNREAARGMDIVVVAVKPWLMPTVLRELRDVVDCGSQTLVSDAANFTTDKVEEALGREGQYLYVIPNIAAEMGEGMSFVAAGRGARAESVEAVRSLYALVGDTMVVPESLVGAGMMMASCGLAYVMRYVRAQMEGGCEMGFTPDQAKRIALQTMQGTVSLLRETGWHPEVAIDKVTTPGGVTIKGLNELDHAGFSSAVIRSLKAGL